MSQSHPGVQKENQGSDYRQTPGLYVDESGGVADKAVAYSELSATQAALRQLITDRAGLESGLFSAAIALSALRVVTVESGQWVYASSGQVSHGNRAIALLQTATNQGGLTKALLQGLVADANWNWMVDQPIYLSLNGLLTQAEPSAQFLRVVAFAISPRQIFFNPQEVIFL